MALGAHGADTSHAFDSMLWVYDCLLMTGVAVDCARVALRMTHRAVASRATVILGKLVIRQFDLFPPLGAVALATIVIRALVCRGRLVAIATDIFEPG